MDLTAAELALIHSALTGHVREQDAVGDRFARDGGDPVIAQAFHARAGYARSLAERVRAEQNRVEMAEHAAAHRERTEPTIVPGWTGWGEDVQS